LLQTFPTIFHVIGSSRSDSHLSLLTLFYSPLKRFHGIARHGQKNLHKIQEIVKKVYHDKA
jgi:hypothetical protein